MRLRLDPQLTAGPSTNRDRSPAARRTAPRPSLMPRTSVRNDTSSQVRAARLPRFTCSTSPAIVGEQLGGNAPAPSRRRSPTARPRSRTRLERRDHLAGDRSWRPPCRPNCRPALAVPAGLRRAAPRQCSHGFFEQLDRREADARPQQIDQAGHQHRDPRRLGHSRYRALCDHVREDRMPVASQLNRRLPPRISARRDPPRYQQVIAPGVHRARLAGPPNRRCRQ